MSEAKHLSIGLTESFNNPQSRLFVSFGTATEGITAAQAATVLGERMNSIWAVTNHVWFWNEVPLRMLRGEAVQPSDLGAPDMSGWVPISDPNDEQSWQAARARCIQSNSDLAAFVAALSPEQMTVEIGGWGPVWSTVQVMFAHNAYHLGEIVTLRHMQGLWVDSKLV
jgi:hypothetical protein